MIGEHAANALSSGIAGELAAASVIGDSGAASALAETGKVPSG